MKRYIAVLLSIFLLANLTACAPSSTETASNEDVISAEGDAAAESQVSNKTLLPGKLSPDAPSTDAQTQEEPQEAEQIYNELVERFYALAADPAAFIDTAQDGETGVIEAAEAMKDDALFAMGYTIEDLSGDGVPELAVGLLPEYGGQINALYTLVDGQPQLVFEGWFRNAYAYLGDGCFHYYGFGGVGETALGTVVLTEDGSALEYVDFLFTHAANNDNSDIRVYYNSTGSWDPAESDEANMTVEEFNEMISEEGCLPLLSFYNYAMEKEAAAAPVRVQWAEALLPELEDYEEFILDDGEYAADVLFTARYAVSDFEFMHLTIREVYDDGTVSYSADPICSMETLTPERPLVVHMTFFGDLPYYGISYVDEFGETQRYTVGVSGFDGSIVLAQLD